MLLLVGEIGPDDSLSAWTYTDCLLAVSFIFLTVQFYINATNPNGNKVGVLQANWRIIYSALTVATNLFTTSLILFRIVYVTGIGPSRTYRGIIEILIESCLLYSIVRLIDLAMFAQAYYDVNWEFDWYYPPAILPSITVSQSLRHQVKTDARDRV